MIHHFPNFVCWQEIFQSYDKSRDKLYIDSISCKIVGLLVGAKGYYFSGPQMAHYLLHSVNESCFFLLANDIASIERKNKLVLSVKDSFEDDIDLLNFIEIIPKNSKVILGISSPKQNKLGIYLYKLRPDLEYFCLGAAVQQTWGISANTFLRGTGFQWLEFLLYQPKRTLRKQKETWMKAFAILFSPSKVSEYRKFIKATIFST